MAFQRLDGTIGLGLTIVGSPDGSPVHVNATINLATLGGTWRDSAGHTGAFVFTPGAGAGGSPRPASPRGGLNGVSLGFGLSSTTGTDNNVSLQVDVQQVKAGLDMRTPNTRTPRTWPSDATRWVRSTSPPIVVITRRSGTVPSNPS